MQQNILKAHDKIFLGVLVYILNTQLMSIDYKLKFLIGITTNCYKVI